jgi:FkbM family methyltransferase
MSYHLFPFDKVSKNSRIVLYGAGNVGKQFYEQITETNFCEIVLWLDKNADGILVKLPETVAGLNTDDYDFAIIAIENEAIALEIKTLLMSYGVPEHKMLHKVRLMGDDWGFDDLRKNILCDFQCKTDLERAEIKTLLQSARQKNLRFSAQVAQDIIAYLFFKGKTDGFYIDIGANDGINGSTTYWAEQIGWKGICIEPQKSTFERMKKGRNCAAYNCAISNKSQENVEFISFPGKDTRSGLADSMSKSHIEAAKQFSNMEKNFVSTKTFGDIMADFENVKFIDFLSIDTEGHEMQVLESIDFTKFKFGLITIETQAGSDVVRYIEKNGYKKLMTAGSDCLFVSKDYNIPISCAIYPFEVGMNQYTELMKNILRTINIKPTDNFTASDFIWFHWFESIANLEDLWQKTNSLKKCKETGRKIIWNVHNKQPHETTNADQIKDFMRLLAQSAYKIVIHSKITTQVIKILCGNDEKILRKIIFVPHPHYAGIYGNLSQQNSLSNDKLKILFFGQIRPYKNIELLIKVFNDLDFDDAELNICGSCNNENYKQNLLNLIKMDKIKTDFRFTADNEVAKLLEQNHILLLPYSLESSLNSGATVLAFSYSRSVISSLTGTLDDIEDKSLFFAYDYKTPEEHERKLKETLTQIREKYHRKYDKLLTLGKKCRESILENNLYLKTALSLSEVFDVKLPKQETGSKPQTSILVPVYNTEKYLQQCLNSILNQTFGDIEVICVNDASTDNSLQILNEYAQKDSRITVVNKTINEDASFARRDALINSSGQYILPIDSDDWIEENMLEWLWTCTKINDYDMVCCDYFKGTQNSEMVDATQKLSNDKLQRIKHGIFGFGNAKIIWNKLVKREIYEKIFFKKNGTNEDCLITAQLFYYANRIGYVNKPLYHYRINEHSVTQAKSLAQKRYEDRKANYEHIIEFCKEKFGNDLSIFEPELSARMADIEGQKPSSYRSSQT